MIKKTEHTCTQCKKAINECECSYMNLQLFNTNIKNRKNKWYYLNNEHDFNIDDIPLNKPRSSTHISTIEWSWSPVHSREDNYYISTNKSRSHWFLWRSYVDELNNENPWVHIIVAYGIKKDTDKLEASKKLIEIYWLGQKNDVHLDDTFIIRDNGLLSKQDIIKISDEIFSE